MAIIDDVRSIIAQSLKLPVEKLAPETRLEELGAESLDVIEIVFALEEKYDIAIPLRADEATRLVQSGGDECNGKEWDANPRIKAFMRAHGMKDNAALQSYFTARVEKLVAAKASKASK